MNESLEGAARQVRELLDAHAAAKSDVTETVDGKVSVTVDSRLQVTAVRLLDQSIDEYARVELEKAIAEAVNVARRRAVLAKADALSGFRESGDWKAAMDGIFKGNGAT
jgi:DNA-binding protein YbaB